MLFVTLVSQTASVWKSRVIHKWNTRQSNLLKMLRSTFFLNQSQQIIFQLYRQISSQNYITQQITLSNYHLAQKTLFSLIKYDTHNSSNECTQNSSICSFIYAYELKPKYGNLLSDCTTAIGRLHDPSTCLPYKDESISLRPFVENTSVLICFFRWCYFFSLNTSRKAVKAAFKVFGITPQSRSKLNPSLQTAKRTL